MEEGRRTGRVAAPPLRWGLLVLAVLSSARALAQQYTVTELPLLPNAYNTVVTGINAAGQVVGESQLTTTFQGEATLWSGTTVSAATSVSYASGVNDAGQVAGSTYAVDRNGNVTVSDATMWNGADFSTTFVAPSFSRANAINGAGQVVGSSGPSGNSQVATIWNMGAATLLPGLSTASGVAYGINKAGQVVGQSPFGNPTNPSAVHATLWNGSSTTDLGTLAGAADSSAQSINASGQVVGSSFTIGSATTGTLWQGGKAIALSPVGGIGNSAALGINDAGEAVGWSNSAPGTTTPSRATLWEDGNALDLNTLAGSNKLFTLTQAVAINNSGQIAADGIDSSGRSLVFLLSPTLVPLPASAWLLAFALSGLAASSRKKSARTTCRGSFPT